MSQHSSISPQLSLILTRAHASDTFIYTTRHTRAEGKVAGKISSEYMKQLHNSLILSMKYIHTMPEVERIKKTTNIIGVHTHIQNKQVI